MLHHTDHRPIKEQWRQWRPRSSCMSKVMCTRIYSTSRSPWWGQLLYIRHLRLSTWHTSSSRLADHHVRYGLSLASQVKAPTDAVFSYRSIPLRPPQLFEAALGDRVGTILVRLGVDGIHSTGHYDSLGADILRHAPTQRAVRVIVGGMQPGTSERCQSRVLARYLGKSCADLREHVVPTARLKVDQ